MTRFCSIFSQLLQLCPRTDFQKAVVATKADRHARGFGCWDQFVALLFCQLGRAHSLREICGGLASCEGRLAHLGASAPPKSTLAYANAHLPWQSRQSDPFDDLLQGVQALRFVERCREFRDEVSDSLEADRTPVEDQETFDVLLIRPPRTAPPARAPVRGAS